MRRAGGPIVVLGAAAVLLAAPRGAPAHPEIDVLETAAAREVARRPGDPEAHLRQAIVHRVAGQWEAALAVLGRAAGLGADPDLVAATRGQVLLDAGLPRRALHELDRVVRRRPDAFRVRFERGRAWGQLGRPERAARDFGRAIAGMRDPTPDHVFARRDALLAAGRREAALAAVEEGIARVGPVVSLELAAVDLEVALGRHARALARLDRLLARHPDHQAWVARRGDLLERAGRGEEARVAWARALALAEARAVRRRSARLDALAHTMRARLARSAETEGER
jgi:Flp pilus assembly protein TadD